MKILYLSPWFPAPPSNGSRLRIFHTLKYLAREHEVHLISFTNHAVTDADAAPLKRFCASLSTVPRREFSPLRARALAGFLSTQPRSVVDTYSTAMQELVRQTVEDVQPEVVIANQLAMAPYALDIPNCVRILEEVELGLLRTSVEQAPNGAALLRAKMTLWKAGRYLESLLRQYDGATVVSEIEQAHVLASLRIKTPLVVVPNGVELPGEDVAFPEVEPDTLSYCGSPTFSANLDAVRYFVQEIFPLIVAEHPRVLLRVTGELPDDSRALPQYEGKVIYTGLLPDVRPLLASSWASIVPLREGGGTRLKILESLAVGTPVIATAKGAQGLALHAGTEYLLANDAHAFAKATNRLLSDASLRNTLSHGGAQAVADRYQWNRVLSRLGAFLNERAQEKVQ